MDYAALKAELATDPVPMGYAGLAHFLGGKTGPAPAGW